MGWVEKYFLSEKRSESIGCMYGGRFEFIVKVIVGILKLIRFIFFIVVCFLILDKRVINSFCSLYVLFFLSLCVYMEIFIYVYRRKEVFSYVFYIREIVLDFFRVYLFLNFVYCGS